jgi:hypothetical protein
MSFFDRPTVGSTVRSNVSYVKAGKWPKKMVGPVVGELVDTDNIYMNREWRVVGVLKVTHQEYPALPNDSVRRNEVVSLEDIKNISGMPDIVWRGFKSSKRYVVLADCEVV